MTASSVTFRTFVHLFWERICELAGARQLGWADQPAQPEDLPVFASPTIELVLCLCAQTFYKGSRNIFYACNAKAFYHFFFRSMAHNLCF